MERASALTLRKQELPPMWTILIFIVIGIFAGWAATLLMRGERSPTGWGVLIVIGISGSLVTGIVLNLIMRGGFRLTPGSIVGSVVVAYFLLRLFTRAQDRREERRRASGTTRPGGGDREGSGRKPPSGQ